MTDDIGESLSFDRFAACIGTDFVWADNDAATTFSLVEAQPLDNAGQPLRAMPFSLIFAASDVRAVDQGSYRLRHPQFGELDIFLVPVARGATGLMFEAIFN